MKTIDYKKMLSYDFSKQKRGKTLSSIISGALKDLDKSYKFPKGYKTEFVKFNDNTEKSFIDDKNKRIYLAPDFMMDKGSFVKDITKLLEQIQNKAKYCGKYDEKNQVDKNSDIFSSTDDLKVMLTMAKTGNLDKKQSEVDKDNPNFKQVEKDVELYLLGKKFLSPKEKLSRDFSAKFVKNMLAMLDFDSLTEEEKLAFNDFKKYIERKEREDYEREINFLGFINGIEREILLTMEYANENGDKNLDLITHNAFSVNKYKQDFGYNPLKAFNQSLALAYRENLADTIFNKCINMDEDLPLYLNNALDIIKYTDFVPSKQQIHRLNEVSKNYNLTIKDKNKKIFPKKILKDFYNIQNGKYVNQSLESLMNEQVNVN